MKFSNSFFLCSTLFLLFVNYLECKDKTKWSDYSECMLTMTAHPLKYVFLTNTMQFNLTFESNCKDYLHHAYFVIPFSKTYQISQFHHPSNVLLKIGGQDYDLQYSGQDKETYGIKLIGRI